tara:strand:- start:11111 stop:12361 length:1251 start_codon:yes stop_codon:yes gene_type:complete
MKQYENLPLISIQRGKGVWLYDFNKKRYLDAISSWWVNLFGHTNSYINNAILEQLEKLEHVMLAGFTHEPVVNLSERLTKLAPEGLNHCFYSSDGASAIEAALKMSFHFWHNHGQPKKNNFISLQNGYHGETLGALSVTDVPIFSKIYTPLLRKSTRIQTPDWRYAKEGESPKNYALRAANHLEKYLAKNHTVTAAFIIEPLVQGAVGMGMYHQDYLKYAREICNKYQVHLIADEIAVGFGRTGTMFACEQANITPDFLCLAKGLTSGYLPLSAVLTSESIYQAFYHKETTRAFLHSHTHAGNALACTAALATLDIFEQNEPIQANHTKIKYLNNISKPIASHDKVRNFRNCGMIWAFEVIDTNPHFSENFFQHSINQGLLLRPLGNTVYFMPPYIINKKEIKFLVDKTLQILDSY